MVSIYFFFFFLLFYALGSFPTGLIIGKLTQKKDLRLVGSRNVGATNASRILGFKWGIVVFLFDFAKGLVPAIICLRFKNFKDLIFINGCDNRYKDIAICLLVILPIFGHMFSIFNKFKGGKAIATSVGVITAINPFIGLLGILFFVLLFIFVGYASLASIMATLLVDLLLFFINHHPGITNISQNQILYFFIGLSTCFIILKHHSNIIRLWQGKEYKFSFIKKRK
ncbi:Putative membrane protein [Candidatus Phytoplasma australiense]|uniref:Glycerol-3-phosphate acyltransferase n=1 Tax=Phytoplasma australiense TaxID=59748 RepID=PLSY_PHYAS|nr:RecName: Full=Glycerol-3-phosphate acyltransferase; AltName: Full=Acyl-PO4 G3P acyltransferase; AltName: Full=Acyl-phosphate--glycerol-3-phosphate acyltransferase; AltName: Full=G3P acyltransferase; Short=GPAT; AltName: Full=Lysophosphatidic acid synthase; Short=LPA synthase [Candidatus Phytoplasma australiense]CAM11601.1 Putative membrane protein [Candidatus Phytoplasma australiense]